MLPAEARGVLAARRCSWPASKQANRCARDITTSGIELAPDSTPAGSGRTAAAAAGAGAARAPPVAIAPRAADSRAADLDSKEMCGLQQFAYSA